MPTYNSVIDRSGASALIPTEVSQDIIKNLPEQSAALSLFRQVQMSASQSRLPVLATLPTAYWVDGDTGLKQTSNAAWSNKTLTAEELAVMVPVPDAVLADSSFDVWGEIMPYIVEAVGQAFDAAAFFGTNAPASFPTAIVPAAVAAGNVVARGTNNAAAGGLTQDVSDTFAKVEAQGFDVNGIVASRAFKGRSRGARSSQGVALGEINQSNAFGVDVNYALSGLWPTGVNAAELIVGDFTKGIVGVRQDITIKVDNSGVISNAAGQVVLNALQQDTTILRVVFRGAFQVANAASRSGNGYPFATLRSPAA